MASYARKEWKSSKPGINLIDVTGATKNQKRAAPDIYAWLFSGFC
jgi:hypothetical protein